jgi:2-C-methyl-D-erythritol 4-phosphate cytidylyltransferase
VVVYALVLAGGVGLRFSAQSSTQEYSKLDKTIPKQLQLQGNCSVLERTVNAFEMCKLIDHIVVVMNEKWIKDTIHYLGKISNSKILDIIKGGVTRAKSSILGVEYIKEHAKTNAKVLIHDAVRPHIKQDQIARTIQALDESDAVLPTIPVVQSIIELGDNGSFAYCERDKYQLAQTPQGFKLDVISAAYSLFEQAHDNFEPTDDISVLMRYSPTARISTIEGSPTNKKITYPSDL